LLFGRVWPNLWFPGKTIPLVRKVTTRIGLIGFGLAGRYFHAPLVAAAGMQLRAVVTSRTEEVRQRFPETLVVASVAQLLAHDDIDLVVVASPTGMHFAHAREALLSGRHVVVDKPLSLNAREAAALEELASNAGRKLSVFQNRRWDGDFLTVRRLQSEGRLGNIAYFRARWDRFRPQVVDRWRERAEPGSGVLFDLGAHLIDQAFVLFGRPDWIQADVFAQRAGAVTDDGFEILMGKGALRIALGASSLAASGDFRYCVHGSSGSFLKGGIDPQEDQLRSGMRPLDAEFGIEPRAGWGQLVSASDGRSERVATARGRWISFYEQVRDSLERGTPLPVAAAEARETLEIIDAARRSSEQGSRIELG
jgi:scyllo-inositol 2-dehydrogenase (NADP+)